jgi:hypothetical protein
MLYMVLERFKDGCAAAIYRRAQECGRLIPGGLHYVSSWVDLDLKRCFQLMETDDPSLFESWIEKWADLAEFEVVPVQTSAQAALAAASRTD